MESVARAGKSDEIAGIIQTSTRQLIGCDSVALIINDNGLCHYVEEDAIGPLWKGADSK